MRKFQEILQKLWPPISGRSWWRREKYRDQLVPSQKKQGLSSNDIARSAVLPSDPESRISIDWRAVEDEQQVRSAFNRFRGVMYQCNRRTKQGAGASPRALWESGKLAGGRTYFYLQPWNDRGYLFEETPRGWVISRAEKITAQAQFMRDRFAWDHVVMHEATDRPGLFRVSSQQMGEGLVSLRLYEDFMSQAFQSEA